MIFRVNVVLNRTVFVDSDWRFDNLCGSHLQSQSELYHVGNLSFPLSPPRLAFAICGRRSMAN